MPHSIHLVRSHFSNPSHGLRYISPLILAILFNLVTVVLDAKILCHPTYILSLPKGLSDDLLGPFEGLNVQSVSGWKQMVVVDDLAE